MSTGNYKNINRYRYDISICTTKNTGCTDWAGYFSPLHLRKIENVQTKKMRIFV